MKKSILLLVLSFVSVIVFGQEVGQVLVSQDTVITVIGPTPTPVGGDIVAWALWIYGNWNNFIGVLVQLLAVFEVGVRFFPTKKDLSFLSAIARFLDKAKIISILTKNRSIEGGTFIVESKKTT